MTTPRETLTAMVRRQAAARPDAPALTLGERTQSFAELDERSRRAAVVLTGLGVRPGDRVAVLDRNSPAHVELLLGAAAIGAALVGINFRLARPEVAAVLGDADAAVLAVGAELVEVVPADAPATVVLGSEWEARLAAADPDAAPAHEPAPDDVVLVLYSSGTTGLPKGAMLTHANLSWTPEMGRTAYGMGPGTVNLVPSPLFHIGGTGYMLTAMGQGGHTVLVRDVEPDAMLDLIARHRVTHAFVVPTVIAMLVAAAHARSRAPDLSSLELIAYGAAPMSERGLAEAMETLGCRFLGVYGMTEAAGSVLCLPPAEHHGERMRSVGRTLPWHDVEVRDPVTGSPCAPREIGEVWVRSPQVMAGYWRAPERTAEVREGDWLRTGDAAWCDEQGYVFLHDRLKDMIITGGENVYPAEVERVLARHPGVDEVVVIGVPHPRWGETVKALVVPRDGRDPGTLPAELVDAARTELARYKCPTSVDLVDGLPRNAAGKVLKRELRARYGPVVP